MGSSFKAVWHYHCDLNYWTFDCYCLIMHLTDKGWKFCEKCLNQTVLYCKSHFNELGRTVIDGAKSQELIQAADKLHPPSEG